MEPRSHSGSLALRISTARTAARLTRRGRRVAASQAAAQDADRAPAGGATQSGAPAARRGQPAVRPVRAALFDDRPKTSDRNGDAAPDGEAASHGVRSGRSGARAAIRAAQQPLGPARGPAVARPRLSPTTPRLPGPGAIEGRGLGCVRRRRRRRAAAAAFPALGGERSGPARRFCPSWSPCSCWSSRTGCSGACWVRERRDAVHEAAPVDV